MEKTDAVRSLESAVVFAKQSIWFLMAVAFLAAAFRLYSLAILGVALSLIWLVSRVWAKAAPARIEAHEEGTARHVFPGESLTSRLTVANTKWLPAPWVEIRRPASRGLHPLADSPYRLQDGGLVCRLGWLSSWQEAAWQVNWQAGRRGAYRAQPSKLRAGDPSAIFYREVSLRGEHEELLVYPRIFPLPQVAPGWQQALGDQRSVDFRYADPLLVAGLRDYHPADPLRRINWVVSARAGSLKANIWEGSAQVRTLICLETASLTAAPWDWTKSELAFELLVSAAASIICQLAEGAGSSEVGFLSDLSHPFGGADKPCYLPAAPGRGHRYRAALLDLLARFKTGPAARPAELANHVRLPLRCNLLVVTARWSEALAERWEEAWPGRRLVWLALEAASGNTPGNMVYSIFPGWQEDVSLRTAVLGEAA